MEYILGIVYLIVWMYEENLMYCIYYWVKECVLDLE